MSISRIGVVSGILAALAVTATVAQAPIPSMRCEDGWKRWSNGGERVCEIREMTVPATGSLSVDGEQNGGVHVTGSDRKDVLVRAMVQAWGDDEEAARKLASEVVVHTDAGIRAEGPDRDGRGHGWSVSYEILTPRNTDLKLETTNGGIAIEDVRGDLDLSTTNGGLTLNSVAGNVHGRATNGGVDVRLTGDTWDGEALDVQTTNGGVTLNVPGDYSARLEAGTTNGGIRIDFPVTVQGRIGRELSTTLGKGGPLVRVKTTNGGVRVAKY
jgi:Putative adhesin